MSTDRESNTASWSLRIATLEARIEEIQAHCDTESLLLHSRLSAQITELHDELRKLAAEVAAATPDAYVRSISAQIEELRAKGDAAYELLHATLTSQDSHADPAGR